MSKKQSLKQGEKILLGIFGVFIVLAVIAYGILEYIRYNKTEPMFVSTTHYNLSAEGNQGSRLFRESRCTSCHRALQNGTNMGLSLDGIGSRSSQAWLYSFLINPEEVYYEVHQAKTFDHGPGKEGNYVTQMDKEELRLISIFLSQLTADQGSSSSHRPPKGKSEFIDAMLGMFAPEDWEEKHQDIREKGFSGIHQPIVAPAQ